MNGEDILDITRRIAIWQFVYYLRVPDGGHAYQTVGSFISRLRRRLRVGDDRELRVIPPEADSIDAVAVMTIHGSKGLEFEAVHLVDIDARHFTAFADSELVPHSLLQSIAPENHFEEETEASNKLYVALSRAKKDLILYETCERYDAVCVNAVSQAAHLFETVRGRPELSVSLKQQPVNITAAPQASYDLAGFLSYRVCPRRYYYDFVKGLRPSAGIHPAALIEDAVMRELFAVGNEAEGAPSHVERILASLSSDFEHALPYLRAYGDQLLATGRTWLGAPRSVMAKPFDVVCSGLSLRVQPHRVTTSGTAVTIEFVRTRPSGKQTRQQKILRWVLKYLTEMYPKYSFRGSIFVLSTGYSESVTPYGRLPEDFFLNSIANGLMAGNFEARPSSWNCPRCRQFMYCPT